MSKIKYLKDYTKGIFLKIYELFNLQNSSLILVSKKIEDIIETGLIIFKDGEDEISYNAILFSDVLDQQYFYNEDNIKYNIFGHEWFDKRDGSKNIISLEECEYIFIIVNDDMNLLKYFKKEISIFETKNLIL